MRGLADLHLHTTASDGTLPPSKLVERAHACGITCLAVTDHDSLESIPEMRKAAASFGMTFIPGAELSCGGEKEIHVLGYGMDEGNDALIRFCEEKRKERLERTREMVRRLSRNSIFISEERVLELAGGVPCRPHVARAIQEAGYASSAMEALRRYLMPGKCGYVPKSDMPVYEGVRVIREAGGIPVLAHPMQLKKSHGILADLIREWARQGLGGIEVYHPSADAGDLPALLRIAKECALLVTGGSDFHGPEVKPGIEIGTGLYRWRTMDEDVASLLSTLHISDASETDRGGA
ncbi:MAG: PHP domain-containing protein [Clostridiales bacterium]|nr:PHP domain-containing protein [Clostridiales bacterium]